MKITLADILAFLSAVVGIVIVGAAGGRYGWAGSVSGGILGFLLGYFGGGLLYEAINSLPNLSVKASAMSPRRQNLLMGAATLVATAAGIGMMYAVAWLFPLARR